MFISIELINGLSGLVTGFLGYRYIFGGDLPIYLGIILSFIWVIIFSTFMNKTVWPLEPKELCLRGYHFALPRKYYSTTNVYSYIKPYFIGFHEIDFLNSKKNINKLIESYEHCLEATKGEKSYSHNYNYRKQDSIKYQIQFLEKLRTIVDRN